MKTMNKDLKSRWSLKNPLYVEKTDKRYARYVKQIKKHGFSDAETWELDSVICQFILPRLIRFREIANGFPGGGDMTSEKWDAIIGQMIFAFEWSLHHEDDKYDHLSEQERKTNWLRYEVGMNQFAKWFRHLWW